MRTRKTMVANSSGPSSRSDLLPSSYATVRYAVRRFPGFGQRRAISSGASPPSSSCAWWAVRAGERASMDGSGPVPRERLEGRGGRYGTVLHRGTLFHGQTATFVSPSNGERKAGARSVRASCTARYFRAGDEHERRDPAVM